MSCRARAVHKGAQDPFRRHSFLLFFCGEEKEREREKGRGLKTVSLVVVVALVVGFFYADSSRVKTWFQEFPSVLNPKSHPRHLFWVLVPPSPSPSPPSLLSCDDKSSL